MDTSKFNIKLTLLTRKLIRDEIATSIAVGTIENPIPDEVGCIMPVSESQALVIMNNGNISAIQPSTFTEGSREKFLEYYSNVNKEPMIFESFDKVEHTFYHGLSAEIDVILRNDRSADIDKLKNLISMAAQKAHENNQFKEQIKAEAVNFFLEKFEYEENRSSLPFTNNAEPKSHFQLNNTNSNVENQMLPKYDDPNNDEDIKISELAKKHPNVINAVTTTSSTGTLLPPII